MNDRKAFKPNSEAPLEWEGIDRMPFPPSDGTVAVLRKFTRDSAGNLLRSDVIFLRKEDLPALRQVVAALEGKSPLGITEAGMLVDRRSDAFRLLVKAGSITVTELRAELNFGPHPDPEKGARFVQSDAELAKPFILESRVDSHDLSAEDAARIHKEFEEAHRGKVNTILLPPGMELKRIDDEAGDLIEYAWGIIANAWGGDWSKAPVDWQDAAKKWRERYHERRNDQAKAFAVKKDHEAIAAMSDATSIVPIPATSADMDYRRARDRSNGETCVGSAACDRCLNVVCQCERASEQKFDDATLSWINVLSGGSFGLTVEQESQFQKDKEAAARAHQAAFGTPSKEFVEKVKALGKANEAWRRTFHKKNNDHARWWVQEVQKKWGLPKPETLVPTNWLDDPVGAVSWSPVTQWLLSAMGVDDDPVEPKINMFHYISEMLRLEPRWQQDTGLLESELSWLLRVDVRVWMLYERAMLDAGKMTYPKNTISDPQSEFGTTGPKLVADPDPKALADVMVKVDESLGIPMPPKGMIVYPKEPSPSVTYWVGEGVTVPVNDAAGKVRLPPELAACAETDRKINQAWQDVLTNAVVSPQPAEVVVDPSLEKPKPVGVAVTIPNEQVKFGSCPNDTDGDGGCGNRNCDHCHPKKVQPQPDRKINFREFL